MMHSASYGRNERLLAEVLFLHKRDLITERAIALEASSIELFSTDH
jgi:hypothetical protein